MAGGKRKVQTAPTSNQHRRPLKKISRHCRSAKYPCFLALRSKRTDRPWRAENTRLGISQTTRSIHPFKNSIYHLPSKNFAPAQDPSPTTNTQSRHSLAHFTATAGPIYYYAKSENVSRTTGSPLEATGTEGSFSEKLGDALVVN